VRNIIFLPRISRSLLSADLLLATLQPNAWDEAFYRQPSILFSAKTIPQHSIAAG
jgi:hypothetical protein